METTPEQHDVVYAGFWRRWAALFIDQLLLGVAFYVVIFALILVLGIAMGASGLLNGGSIGSTDPTAWAIGAYFGMFALYYGAAALYYALMESSRHQATLGKMALGIKVTDGQGRRLGFGRALARWFACTLSYLTLYIGFLMAAFTERKRALHDMVAGTLVVDRWAFTDHPELQRRELGGCLVAIIAGVLLLFFVAIAGMLAAIALPAYQDYTARSKVVQTVAETTHVRMLVADFQASEGRCPVNGEGGLPAPDAPGITHATRLQAGEFDEGACGLELELGGTGSTVLDGGRVWWELDPSTGDWTCSSDIADSRLPLECRG